MSDRPRAICGHLERGGHQGTEICEATPNHPGDHVMVIFDQWVTEEIAWHQKLNRPIPHWLWTIAEEARQFGAGQLAQALAEDRDRRRRPSGDGAVPGTRVDRPEWRQVAETGGEWRAPDDGGRSVAPPTPGKVPPGVELHHAGSIGPRRREGANVADVAEVKALAGGIVARLTEAQAQVEAVIEIIQGEKQAAVGLFRGSGQEAANAAISWMASAESSCDDVIANLLNAVEQVNTYSASL